MPAALQEANTVGGGPVDEVEHALDAGLGTVSSGLSVSRGHPGTDVACWAG